MDDLREPRPEPTNLGKGGEHELAANRLPARRLYEHLIDTAESMPEGEVIEYLQLPDDTQVVIGRDDYSVVHSNLSRRGLSFAYASAKLYFILCGTEPAPKVTRS